MKMNMECFDDETREGEKYLHSIDRKQEESERMYFVISSLL